MNKYIIVFVLLLSSCILGTNSVYYMPMSKRTVEFGEEICRYEEYKDQYKPRNLITYVKPCEVGKICKQQGTTNDYTLYACQPLDLEYDNSGKTCQTKDNSPFAKGVDCTSSLSCYDGTCRQYCPDGQVIDQKATGHPCVNDPNICEEYDSNYDLIKKYDPAKNKQCVEIELSSTNGKNYRKKKLYSNYIASIDDGKFISSINYRNYCKSGYALYFYGNGNLANPNTDSQSSEIMYPRCVTILGVDTKKIIKYTIDNGDEMYYDYSKLPFSYENDINVEYFSDYEYFMLKAELFKNYKQKMDDLNCRETGCKDEDKITELSYFYYYPDKYLLYKDEPQVVEYLIKEVGGNRSYKAKHTSSNGANSLNIKYLMALLSLILLI